MPGDSTQDVLHAPSANDAKQVMSLRRMLLAMQDAAKRT
jgi:hypothetical protein